ncbi:hypothetical protein BpHYR1_018399 [Brachionus plicatilis]|uniref:Uncharacterized protein n=1 Tax=Brachionus plicatilis TaxID=10195 RepID=A0A3M7P7K2_BRAPC|nr:hypothetical protein BpHYR1_018399 [Brachionus plicatilis]
MECSQCFTLKRKTAQFCLKNVKTISCIYSLNENINKMLKLIPDVAFLLKNRFFQIYSDNIRADNFQDSIRHFLFGENREDST